MRRSGTITLLAVLVGCFAGAAPAGQIELNLQAVLADTHQQDTVSALVYLSDRVDLAGLEMQLERGDGTLRHRHEVVVTALRARAETTQAQLLAHLETLTQAGTLTSYQPFWIANCVRIEATPAAIQAPRDWARTSRATMASAESANQARCSQG